MQILFKVNDIKEYVRMEKDFKWPDTPCKKCPICRKYCKIYKHGFFQRHYVNLHLDINEKIYIKRYFCTNCLKTISLLPSFCISRFILGFNHIFMSVYKLLKRTCSLEIAVDKLNAEFETGYISKQQFYNYLNRLIFNIPMIESFVRDRYSNLALLSPDIEKKERVWWLLNHIKKEFDRLDIFLYEFYKSTNRSPITLYK
jgi:hypothetical protein